MNIQQQVNEILNNQIVQNVSKFILPSNDIKRLFSLFSIIFKKSLISQAIRIIGKSDKITFLINTNVLYKAEFPCKTITSEFDYTYKHKDIEVIINENEDIQFICSPEFMYMNSTSMSIPFIKADSVVNVVNINDTKTIDFNSSIVSTIKTLSQAKILGKELKISNNYSLESNWVRVIYPNIEIGIYMKGLNMDFTIDEDSADILLRFMETNKNIECKVNDKYIIFISDNAELCIIKENAYKNNNFEKYFNESKKVTSVSGDLANTIIQSLYKVYKKSDVTVILYEKGITFEINTDGCRVKKSFGNINSDVKYTFVHSLHFLSIISKLWGEIIRVYVKGAIICIHGSKTMMIFTKKS